GHRALSEHKTLSVSWSHYQSSLEDILLEITSLVDNALDLAEITEEYSH
ncbi:hypothetical protein ACEOBG_12455, partial [Escherichia coli]